MSKDKQVRPAQSEQKGFMHDVALPIAQSGVGGVTAGAANAWLGNKLGGGQKEPPPQKDE